MSADHENRPGRTPPKGAYRAPADLTMALRLFSRLPTGPLPHEAPDLSRIAPVLPLASLLIVIGPALLLVACGYAGLPALYSSLLALAAYAIATGAMGEDAIADASDGLFGGTTPERRLDILKDSRHGTYGVLAIVFSVGLRATALAAITARDPIAAACALIAATVLARSISLYLPFSLPPARREGAGATAGRPSWNTFLIGLVLALLIAALIAAPLLGIFSVAMALVVAAPVCIYWGWLCRNLIGGQTGDLTGALGAYLEAAIISSFMVIFIH